jgi:hypothetical protein
MVLLHHCVELQLQAAPLNEPATLAGLHGQSTHTLMCCQCVLLCWCLCAQGLEGKVLELRTELRSALATAGRQVAEPPQQVL